MCPWGQAAHREAARVPQSRLRHSVDCPQDWAGLCRPGMGRCFWEILGQKSCPHNLRLDATRWEVRGMSPRVSLMLLDPDYWVHRSHHCPLPPTETKPLLTPLKSSNCKPVPTTGRWQGRGLV